MALKEVIEIHAATKKPAFSKAKEPKGKFHNSLLNNFIIPRYFASFSRHICGFYQRIE